MSKIIASAAIRGAHKLVERAENDYQKALDAFSAAKEVGFPNTAYYLPVIYAMSGLKVEKLEDIRKVLDYCKELLPPVPGEKVWTPYLGGTLDAGMATLFADEVIEVIKYLENPVPYSIMENCPEDGDFWLGAADDIIMRKRGIEFVDGTAPGFAACVGVCPSEELAVKIARELQEKNLYVFMTSGEGLEGPGMADQLRNAGVQMGWETRLVPFGHDISATVFALGFASRAAMSFGGIKPGDYKRNLLYNKDRVFAFVLAFGCDPGVKLPECLEDEKYAQAAGAINYGFPTITNNPMEEILPTGVCTYEHVVSNIPCEDIVQKAVEVRGLKVQISEVPVPVSFGPAFEGERIRKDEMACEMGGNKTPAFEHVKTVEMENIKDGDIEVIGPEIDDVEEGKAIPLGIVVQVAGREMQSDFEPILERQLHRVLNYAQGIFHMGQRDINWVRFSKEGKKAGLKFSHIGSIIHAKFHEEYNAILDKVAVKVYTNEADVSKLRDEARKVYHERDDRLKSMTDESVETFYSCTLCQSFAPNHVCVISPERSGLCGAYNWLDGKAAYKVEPTGPNQPLAKGEEIDKNKGQWQGINAFVSQASRGNIEVFNAYSIMEFPMTSCGCFEVISAILPMSNAVMCVNREFPEMTPCGMKFSTLAGSVGGGLQTPGFVGHSKHYIGSAKFLRADGGLARIAWLPKMLKEEIGELITKRAQEMGLDDFLSKIADETIATTEEEVMEYMQKVGHPALTMDPLM